MKKDRRLLPREFYTRPDVVAIARELPGKFLYTNDHGVIAGGMISETEAYEGITDRASHAWNGRRTKRTEVMFRIGGTAYVYLCYGMYSLFNVVTNQVDIPHAVLIRGLVADTGIDIILKRLNKRSYHPGLTSGPGRLAKALGIHFRHSGFDLCQSATNKTGFSIWIEDKNIFPKPTDIIATPRIGIEYAGEGARLPYRFLMNAPSNLFPEK
ncbi:MAG: DNA-3-methyladenine glycosylase [Bacteroidetes bacterium]|nr:DNA-3-methyladenine glycosylase [Bacteroidota bacterium]